MNIRAWWDSLLERERRILSIGGVLVGIFLLYVVIWSPLSNAVSNAKTRAQSQQQLLRYLQNAEKLIAQYKALGIATHAEITRADLLSEAQETLSKQGLSSFLKQVQQPTSNQLSLTFDAVPFDHLMAWLENLTTTRGVKVLQLSATRLPEMGMVEVKVVLGV